MELSDEAVQRLAALGMASAKSLRFWQDVHGKSSSRFWRVLEHIEKEAVPTADVLAAFNEWAPKLWGFAAACRTVVPVPRVESFSAAEWAEYRVMLMRMREFRSAGEGDGGFFPNPAWVRGVSTTVAGLAAAVETFCGNHVVIMTQSEWLRWRDISKPTDGRKPYKSEVAWWVRLEEGDPEVSRVFASPESPPMGSEDWVISCGSSSGPTAGSGHYERWRWNGNRLQFLKTSGLWIS